MAKLKVAVAVAAGVCESLTCTVKVAVCWAVGVPVILPNWLRLSPVGKLPEAMLHVYGGTPPLAASDAVYGTLTDPEVSVVVVTARAELTVMDLDLMSTAWVGVCESVTETLKVVVPRAVGVPLITPDVLMLSPGGRVPEARAQVNGCKPPPAVRVAE